MARARLLKPSFFTNDDLAALSMSARLLFAGLWTIADREGRLEDRPKKIKAEVLPFDSVNIDRLLTDLCAAGFIARYESENLRLIQIVAFARHQSPHPKEPASRLPAIGEPVISNGQNKGEPIAEQEVAQSARGTLADPFLPIPNIPIPLAVAGSSIASASAPFSAAAAVVETPLPIRVVLDAWTNATGMTVTAQTADAIDHWLEKVGEGWVLDAIRETGDNNAKAWKYTAAILERWFREGREPLKPVAGGARNFTDAAGLTRYG